MGQKVTQNRSKIETTSPCCSQEAPRPSQGCPRDPQGLHLGAFWCPRAPPRVPKGPPRAPFWTILGVLLPPWHHFGIHLKYFCYFWSNFGPFCHQPAHKSNTCKNKVTYNRQRAAKHTKSAEGEKGNRINVFCYFPDSSCTERFSSA